jgi:hypothetical protein
MLNQWSCFEKPINQSLQSFNRQDVNLTGLKSLAYMWPFLPCFGMKTTLVVF